MNQNWSYKDSCFVINNLNGIKKHVKDISVDAVLGCVSCSVIIYIAKYAINNYIIPTTVSSPYHQGHSPDINSVLPVIL